MGKFSDMLDPNRNRDGFTAAQKSQASKLEEAWKKQGLPKDFSHDGAHIWRDAISGKVFISNSSQKMCMLNNGRLEIYLRCPKCLNEGFKNTSFHNPKCELQYSI